MTWYEALLWLGGGASAIWAIARFLKPVMFSIKKRLETIDAMALDLAVMKEHDKEQYLSILRLTVMAHDMPISERIIAGKKYIDEGGNGEVKAYYEELIDEHTK